MPTLSKELRRQLENTVLKAREEAERGAAAALESYGVGEAKKPTHLDKAGEDLRKKLRARGRQAGDLRRPDDSQEVGHLVQECAYEHWHRMLFARFLAENGLLIEPESGLDVDLDYCEEQARESKSDKWQVAASFAQRMLTSVFRLDDPALQLRLPTEFRNRLATLLASLPAEVFTASDSLGWTYQFWQTKRKKEVNESGVKIGAAELSPVTQLFTEDYMVDFLLDNTLGAWHAGKVLAANPKLAENAQSEDELRQAVALPGCPWKYLRFIQRSTGVPPVTQRSMGVSPVTQRSAGVPPVTHGQDARAPLAPLEQVPFFDPYREIEIHKRNLPHWQQEEVWIFVTWRLADSLPAEKLSQWKREKEDWIRHHPEPWDEKTTCEFHETFSKRMDDWLDSGKGSCVLSRSDVRKVVVEALHHFDGQRYELGDFVVMPNHVHVLVRPRVGRSLADLLHSWKSFTSKQINRALGHSGTLWQEDYWDRLIRHERHLTACQRYIAENPMKAGIAPEAYTLWQRSMGVAPVNQEAHGRDAHAPLRWTPAAGTFDGWPKTADALRALDPCMGSGHFVVAMFERLVALRLAEERSTGVPPVNDGAHGQDARAPLVVAAVIRDNLFGLEIDPRCTQIAAFNLALAAWRRVGHCKLPSMNLACSGLAPNTREADWLALAGDNDKLKNGMERLYRLFQKAAVLGSLINPRADEGDLLVAGFHELQPLLEQALAQETKDDTAHEMAVTARGLAKAAEILAGQFTLVATNVPYLKNGKQEAELQEHCERHYRNSKGNLACVFVERCIGCCKAGSTFAGVVINEMLFLVGYRKLREHLLADYIWQFAAKLGTGAFETITGEVVNVSLLATTRSLPDTATTFLAIDAGDAPQPQAKADMLRTADPTLLSQKSQLLNPDARITVSEGKNEKLLSAFSDFGKGSVTGDGNHYLKMFWELPAILPGYRGWLKSPNAGDSWSGREHVVMWDLKGHDLRREIGLMIRGDRMWGQKGVAVCKMSGMNACVYAGELFDDNVGVLLPNKQSELPAIFAFAESPDYRDAIRKIDQAIKVTAATLVKVPFDLAHWQKVAAEKYPDGLPKPFSRDPTQWLFNGHPNWSVGILPAMNGGQDAHAPLRRGQDAHAPLQVAVARLLGYQWPRQTGSSFPDCPALGPDGLEKHADKDGVVCFSQVRDEPPAADRLRALLADAFGAEWSHAMERKLIAASGSKAESLEGWLLNDFFAQHCGLFHSRPFVWHLWDGRKDGFNVLVNYHRLAGPNGEGHRTLETLAYAYLGDWITRQKNAVAHGEAGAEDRLAAALELQGELKKIVAGEPPYDLFIRWKPLHEQPIGWQPDINDGVRLNIRPFLSVDLSRGKKGCGPFRTRPGTSLKWDKDRGNEPHRSKEEYPWFWSWDKQTVDFKGNAEFDGNRWNDCHYTTALKRAARERKAQTK